MCLLINLWQASQDFPLLTTNAHCIIRSHDHSHRTRENTNHIFMIDMHAPTEFHTEVYTPGAVYTSARHTSDKQERRAYALMHVCSTVRKTAVVFHNTRQ